MQRGYWATHENKCLKAEVSLSLVWTCPSQKIIQSSITFCETNSNKNRQLYLTCQVFTFWWQYHLSMIHSIEIRKKDLIEGLVCLKVPANIWRSAIWPLMFYLFHPLQIHRATSQSRHSYETVYIKHLEIWNQLQVWREKSWAKYGQDL